MLLQTSSPFLGLFIFLYLKGREIFHQLVPSPDAHKGQGQELRTAPTCPAWVAGSMQGLGLEAALCLGAQVPLAVSQHYFCFILDSAVNCLPHLLTH